jgi:hypothetical protein
VDPPVAPAAVELPRAVPDGGGPERRLVAEGWGALVGYDYPAGRAAPLPPRLVAALREAGATQEAPE